MIGIKSSHQYFYIYKGLAKKMAQLLLVFAITSAMSYANSNQLVEIYNEQKRGDLSDVSGPSQASGNLGHLKKGKQLIVIGSLASEDYRDSIYFEAEEAFTVTVLHYSGQSEKLVTFGFGPEFEQFSDGVETVSEPGHLYQGASLKAGAYRFDFGAPGGPNPNDAIDQYAIHISVDSGLEKLPENSLLSLVGNGQYFLRADDSAFLLETNEWLDIETFLMTAINLPLTESQARQLLSIDPAVGFNIHFARLLEEYNKLNESALLWEQKTYLGILAAASQFVDEERIREKQFINPIQESLNKLKESISSDSGFMEQEQPQFSQESVQTLMEDIIEQIVMLQGEIGKSVDSARNNSTALSSFSTDLEVHYGQLSAITNNFINLLAEDNSVSLQSDINQLNQQITNKNNQIADKERRLALSAIGGGIAAAIASSVLVPQIKSLKRERDSLQQQRSNKQSQLDNAIALYSAYGSAETSVESTRSVTGGVREYFKDLKLQWQSLHSDVSAIYSTLNLLTLENEEGDLIQLDPVIFNQTVSIIVDSIANEMKYIRNKNRSYINYRY